MAKVYLINVGANTAHQNSARGPIFCDGTFEYVSFPDKDARQTYPSTVRGFLSPSCSSRTHLDPDWKNHTYGDNCSNPRARALLQAKPNDVLLFWALLWRNNGNGWNGWTGERGWYFLGSIRIQEILEAGDSLIKLHRKHRKRAALNAHIFNGAVNRQQGRTDRVFVGNTKRSCQFQTAVDMQIGTTNGLLQCTILSSDGRKLNWHKAPKWNSALRSCRAVWDLGVQVEHQRACIVRDAIRELNPQFDLLDGF